MLHPTLGNVVQLWLPCMTVPFFFSSNAIPPFRAFAKVIIGGETDTGVVAMRCPLVCGSPVAKFSRIESSCSNILLLAMGAFFFAFGAVVCWLGLLLLG